MPKKRLTDSVLISLKSQPGQYEIWDMNLASFGVRVSQGGTKTFVLKHQNRRITLGRYPILSLAEARGEARRILAEFTLGRNRPRPIVYNAAVEQFLEEKSQTLRPNSIRSYRHHLGLFSFRLLEDISQHDLAQHLKKLAATPAEHRQTAVTLKLFFRWCIKRDYLSVSPAGHLSTFKGSTRTRILTDAELKAVWRAAKQVEEPFGTIVKLLILTGQRRSEVAGFSSTWIQNDVINLPAEICKNGRSHSFPIGTLSQQLISSQLPSSNSAPPLFFPGRGTSSPFAGWSKSKAALDEICGITGWTLHDLRRTFATRLADMGVAPHIIERLLNHVSGTISGVSATYNRARYLPEMRAAVELWENYLLEHILKKD